MPAKRSFSQGTRPPAPEQGSHPIITAIFTLGLLALGVMTFVFGKRSIVSEYFEYPNRHGSHITIGSLGFNDQDFRILEGPEAIYWGIAFCALGVMFSLWGCGLGLLIFTPKMPPGETSALGRLNTWLSLVALLISLLCLFPPWRLGSLWFYAVSVLLIGSIVYSVRRHRPALPKKVIPGLIVAAVLAGEFHLTSFCVGIVLAMVAMLFVGAHVLILNPHLMKLEPGRKEPEPSGSFDD